MIVILMMSAKFAIPGLLKLKVFWNNGDSVTIFVHNLIKKFYYVTQIILQIRPYDQSLVTLAFI